MNAEFIAMLDYLERSAESNASIEAVSNAFLRLEEECRRSRDLHIAIDPKI
jgi:hypothetical protein